MFSELYPLQGFGERKVFTFFFFFFVVGMFFLHKLGEKHKGFTFSVCSLLSSNCTALYSDSVPRAPSPPRPWAGQAAGDSAVGRELGRGPRSRRARASLPSRGEEGWGHRPGPALLSPLGNALRETPRLRGLSPHPPRPCPQTPSPQPSRSRPRGCPLRARLPSTGKAGASSQLGLPPLQTVVWQRRAQNCSPATSTACCSSQRDDQVAEQRLVCCV